MGRSSASASAASALHFIHVFCVQLEPFEVSVAPDLQQQLASVVQELGVHIPPPVSHQK